jgi:hypothetical protein
MQDKIEALAGGCAPAPSHKMKTMGIPFRQSCVNDVADECMQIAQITDEETGICYELVKHLKTGSIIVHYFKNNQYIIKQYTNRNIDFEDSIRLLGLSVDDFALDDDIAYYSAYDMLSWKVRDLPLIQGTIKCPRCKL